MFTTILYFLPSIVSGLWCVIFLTKLKNKRQTLYTVLLAAFAFYYAANAIYIAPHTDYDALVVMDAMDIPLVLSILAIIIMYFHFFHTKAKFSGVQITLFIPAIVVGTIINLLYYIIGFDNAAKLVEIMDQGMPVPAEYKTEIYRIYAFFSEPFVNFCATIFFLLIGIEYIVIGRKKGYSFGAISRFFFKRGSLTPEFAIASLIMVIIVFSLPMTFFGRRFFLDHVSLGIINCFVFAALQHFISYIEYYSDSQLVLTLYSLSHLQVTPLPEPAGEGKKAEEAEVKMASPRMMKVAEQFHTLMDEKHIYKDEAVSLSAIAEDLGVSRASLSTLIMHTYGMPFRELLNKYRIQHAKHFMQDHPTATQEDVAHECGYKNAQYLNSKFKETTGCTPAMWMAQNTAANKDS